MKRVLLAALVLFAPARAEAQTFRRPFACDECIANWFYFDHTGETAGTQDWSCEGSTYEGHRGTDFSLRGGLAAIDVGHDVVAAADGEVVRAQDGFFDRCTACGGDNCGTAFGFGYGNHVVIDHGDTRVVYAHLRNGSVRVAPGDRVTCGQVLGQIASSGCSTGAHLHFETRPPGGASASAFDPFAGACSPTSPSRWSEQGAHRGIPSATCGAAPTCPDGTFPIWTCDEARTARRRCVDGVDTTEPCAWGCISMPSGTDDACAPAPDADADGASADLDCDDTDPDVHPGAIDTCGDAIDQDCAGGDLLCRGDDGGAALDAGARDPASISGSCGCRVGARTHTTAVTSFLVAATIALRIRQRRSKPSPRVCD